MKIPLVIGAAVALAVVFGRGKAGAAEPATPTPAGPPPIPADYPQRPGGYKPPSLTVELSAKAQGHNAGGGNPIGSMVDFVHTDGKTYGLWTTYHLSTEGDRWLRAVEVWEKL